MLVLTATTENGIPLTEIQKQSALLFGAAENEHLTLAIPEDYPRHPSWFKIQALIRHLRQHDRIWWVDSDAMFVAKDGWDATCSYFSTINEPVSLCKDSNGWNCGIMMWRNSDEAIDILWRLYDSYDMYRDHPWSEQASFHVLAESLRIRELPKSVYNCYETELNRSSMVLHLPNRPQEDRIHIMQRELTRLKSL